MVHFQHKLELGLISKWRKHYLDYERMQQLIEAVSDAVKYNEQCAGVVNGTATLTVDPSQPTPLTNLVSEAEPAASEQAEADEGYESEREESNNSEGEEAEEEEEEEDQTLLSGFNQTAPVATQAPTTHYSLLTLIEQQHAARTSPTVQSQTSPSSTGMEPNAVPLSSSYASKKTARLGLDGTSHSMKDNSALSTLRDPLLSGATVEDETFASLPPAQISRSNSRTGSPSRTPKRSRHGTPKHPPAGSRQQSVRRSSLINQAALTQLPAPSTLPPSFRAFLQFYESELNRINNFFVRKATEVQQRFAILQKQTHRLLESRCLNGTAVQEPTDDSLNIDVDIESHISIWQQAANAVKPSKMPETGSSTVTIETAKLNDPMPRERKDTNASPPMVLDLHTSESIKRTFQDLYRQAMYLQSYCVLNYTGFVKAMKKFDKVSGCAFKAHYITLMDSMPFYEAQTLKPTVEELEHLFAGLFYHCDVEAARAVLLAKCSKTTDWGLFDFGVRLGANIMLLTWVLWDAIVDTHVHPVDADDSNSAAAMWSKAVLPIYRGFGCLLLAYWCWGVCLYLWNRFRINFMFLFELDPRHTSTYRDVFRIASTITSLSLLNFLLYFKTMRGDVPKWIPAGYMPATLFVGLLALVVPGPWRPTNQIARALLQVVVAPFGRVDFFTSFLGDILTSLVKVFVDIAYTSCFFFSGEFIHHHLTGENTDLCRNSDTLNNIINPLIAALPLWIRFCQCLRRFYDTGHKFPHLANAGKYACAHTVVFVGAAFQSFIQADPGFGLYKIIWMLCITVSTLYAYIWDVTQDWGLAHGWRSKNFLRDRLMYYKRWVYYMAIVIDLFLRFAWTLTLVPSGKDSPFGEDFSLYVGPVLAAGEVVRRSMWALFRLENEHLSNTQGYRSIDQIPMHFEGTVSRQQQRAQASWRVAAALVAFAVLVAGIAVTVYFT